MRPDGSASAACRRVQPVFPARNADFGTGKRNDFQPRNRKFFSCLATRFSFFFNSCLIFAQTEIRTSLEYIQIEQIEESNEAFWKMHGIIGC